MTMEIKTNHKWKKLKYGYEVPKKVLDEYNWLSEEEKTDGWLCYRKSWYHISDFLRLGLEKHLFSGNWHGYNFFSKTLIELSNCGDGYRIGTYLS